MYPAAIDVTANEDFSLTILFNDGTERILDMTPYLSFGVFKRISTIDAFKRVHISFDTVAWDCGVDLDPEFLRNKGRQVTHHRGSDTRAD